MKFQDVFPKPDPGSWEKIFLKEAKMAGEVLPEIENAEQLTQRYFYTQSENLQLTMEQLGWKIRQRINTQIPDYHCHIENCLHNGVEIIEINDITVIADIPEKVSIGLYDVSLSQVLNAMAKFPKHKISWADGFLPPILSSGVWQEPNWNEIYDYIQVHQKVLPLTVSLVRNGGATVVHEITIACLAMDYIVQKLIDRNISAENLAQRLSLRFATGPHLMSEIAKYRSARILWEQFWYRYGIKEVMPACIVAETTTWNVSPVDPHTDLLRATGAAFASVAGTANELLVSPCPESEISSVEFGLRMARNLQHILREEAYLAAVSDPAAGAYYPETLSQQIISQTNESFRHFKERGNLKTLLLGNELTPLYAKRKEQLVKGYREKQQTLIGVTHYLNPILAEKKMPTKLPSIDTDFMPVDQTPIAFLL